MPAYKKNKKRKNYSNSCMHFTSVTDSDRGEVLCGQCGLVLLEKITDNHPQSMLTKDGQPANIRTGPSTSLSMYDKGLYTVIGRDQDSTGKRISGRTKSTFSRLRIWDQRSKSSSAKRSMGKAFTTLDGMRSKLGIPENTSEKAAYYYRKGTAKGLAKGRSVIPIIAASLYVACREGGIPRSLSDIAKAANVRRRTLSRTVRALLSTLDQNIQQYDTNSFISRICNSIGLSEKTKREAVKILEKLKVAGVSEGKNPVALAAASVYVSTLKNDEKVVQTKLAKVAGVSAVTVRNLSYEIKKILKL